MSDFEFLTPLWLLALLPLGGIVIWLANRKQAQGLIASHIANALGLETKERTTAWIRLLAFSWLLSVIALAGPSFEKQTRPSYTSSHARVLVMDMSLSMYATDIKPNRLTQARYKALDLLKGWDEGSTALVAYAGDAYTVSPLTSDSSTIANLLPNLSPDIMPYPGANAASGIKVAIEMLKNAGLAQGDIILLADDLDQQEQSDIEKMLAGTHWKLNILAIGSQAGAPITLSDGSLMKTDNGQTVVAKTDFKTMQSLAHSINGVFTPYQDSGHDVERILAQQGSQQDVSKKDSSKTLVEPVNKGYWLLPLLIIPALLLFRRGVIFTLAIAVGVSSLSPEVEASPWLNQNQQAMKSYDKQDYQAASEQFTDPEWQGVARYQNKDFKGAIESFSKIENPSSRTQYNLANAYAQNGELEKAKELYQQVLNQDPNNEDAKRNLGIVEQALQQQQQQQQQQQAENSDTKDAQQTPKEQENKPEQNKTAEQQAQANNQEQSQSEKAKQTTVQQQPLSSTTENVDPELRKLEQVESARDPSQLLRAQLILQAQEKQPPQTNGKKW